MKFNRILSFLPFTVFFLLASCNRANEKINNVGEKVGEATGEMVQKVTTGVENALELKVEFSDTLKKSNISTGKILLADSAGGKDNLISIYFIYPMAFKGTFTLKALDNKGLEMGRASTFVNANKDDAAYVDFLFDRRTNIDYNSKLTLDIAK
jgi:hypothetical protein